MTGGSPRWWPALLCAATLATYGTGLRNGFVWDDHQIIENRPQTSLGAAALEVLTTPDVLLRSQPAPYYRPLARLALVLERAAFGLRPAAFHLVNLLLHAAVALALFGLALRLLGSPWAAGWAALLFALHPVNAESVDLAVAINNLLVALLLLLALRAYLEARERQAARPLAVAVLLFGLALGCKETAAMLLPLLVLLEAWPPSSRPSPWRERGLRLAAMALAALPYAVARALVLGGAPAIAAPLGGVGDVAGRILQTVPRLLALVVWPSGLTIFHPLEAALPVWVLAVSWLGLLGGTALVWRTGRLPSVVGLGWLAAQLLPVSGLVPIPSGAVAERFLYLPSLGLALLVGEALLALRTRWPASGRAATAASTALALLLAGRTAWRTLEWRDDLTLFAAAVRVDPSSVDASYDLGVALDGVGRAAEAAAEWRRTLALEPGHVGALSQLGTQAAAAGDLPRALDYFQRVLEVAPRDAETRFNVALLLERAGRSAEALRHYRLFLEGHPVDYPELVPRVEARVRQLERQLAPPGARP